MRFVCRFTTWCLHRIVLGLTRQCVVQMTDSLQQGHCSDADRLSSGQYSLPFVSRVSFISVFSVVTYGYRVGFIRVVVPTGRPTFCRWLFDLFSLTLHSPHERNITASWKRKSARLLGTVPFHAPVILAVFCVDVRFLPRHSSSYRNAESDHSVRYLTFVWLRETRM